MYVTDEMAVGQNRLNVGLDLYRPNVDFRALEGAVARWYLREDSARRLNERAGMNSLDNSDVTRKIRHVQGKEIRNAVDQHRGDQTRIVYLDALTPVIPD